MKVEWNLQPNLDEPTVVIHAREKTDALLELEQQLLGLHLSPIPAEDGTRTLLLQPAEILRFYTDGKGVLAQTEAQTCTVHLRLYELKLSGTIRITLQGGVVTYASRRYVKKIKEALGLGRRMSP